MRFFKHLALLFLLISFQQSADAQYWQRTHVKIKNFIAKKDRAPARIPGVEEWMKMKVKYEHYRDAGEGMDRDLADWGVRYVRNNVINILYTDVDINEDRLARKFNTEVNAYRKGRFKNDFERAQSVQNLLNITIPKDWQSVYNMIKNFTAENGRKPERHSSTYKSLLTIKEIAEHNLAQRLNQETEKYVNGELNQDPDRKASFEEILKFPTNYFGFKKDVVAYTVPSSLNSTWEDFYKEIETLGSSIREENPGNRELLIRLNTDLKIYIRGEFDKNSARVNRLLSIVDKLGLTDDVLWRKRHQQMKTLLSKIIRKKGTVANSLLSPTIPEEKELALLLDQEERNSSVSENLERYLSLKGIHSILTKLSSSNGTENGPVFSKSISNDLDNMNQEEMIKEGRLELENFVKEFGDKITGLSDELLLNKAVKYIKTLELGGSFAEGAAEAASKIMLSPSVFKFVGTVTLEETSPLKQTVDKYFDGEATLEGKLAKIKLAKGESSKAYKFVEKCNQYKTSMLYRETGFRK